VLLNTLHTFGGFNSFAEDYLRNVGNWRGGRISLVQSENMIRWLKMLLVK